MNISTLKRVKFKQIHKNFFFFKFPTLSISYPTDESMKEDKMLEREVGISMMYGTGGQEE